MILIIGLGNIGKEYQSTRHNVGFMSVDYIAHTHELFWNVKSKLHAEIVQGVMANRKILLAKPQTYMNLSGQSAGNLCSYYNIKSDNVIVIHDDIDLEVGRIKYKVGGGSGGHNGLKSIDHYIGNNYQRIRIGVGKPVRNDTSDYVLSSFKNDEVKVIVNSIKVVNENINLLITGKSEEFKNEISK